MASFAQFLNNDGIHMEPAEFIGIIAGGVVLLILLIATIIYLHRRSKRRSKLEMITGEFDKSAWNVVSLTRPHPPLPPQQSSRPSWGDPESQKDVVGRQVRQQEQTYMQLMSDLRRPSSRTDTPPLPSQAPREPYGMPRMVQRDPTQVTLPRSPLTALYPAVAAPTPPPVATLAPPGARAGGAQLKRGPSVRSLDSASEYSVASAPSDLQERTYQPFNLGLATIPASPSTPTKWPSSPGSYVWPKRQRTSLMREELAPETYAKVRWRTDENSIEPDVAIPVAQALAPAIRSVSSPTSPGPTLRINVPPSVQYLDNPDSAATGQFYTPNTAQFYADASATSSSPTVRTPTVRTPKPF
ncbi:hypothetical protein DFH07DRAFT_802556 [Mycena maculata]|uniref:Uncharacterized protein n=1 Tax=Mycena maculata TaxID=230809 RepID=A0AAD7JVM8_9AGAR|nr:hypothetical protein DFH07DRAFT_802556 [Mycena maculata]